MKILNISLDQNIVDKNSAVAKRIVDYGTLVEKFTVLVLADGNSELQLSDKADVISVKKSNKILGLLKLKNKAEQILRADKYDIITVQDVYFVGYLALILAKKFSLGLEVQVHGWEKFSGIRKILAKKVLQQADAVRVVSQRLKRQIIEDFSVEEENITVVPVYTERVTRNVQRITQNQKRFVFLTVGRLVPVKNIEMQIKAIAEISRQFHQTELRIVGDGKQRQKLEKMCYALRVTRYVKFLGWQDNLKKFYGQTDAFLLTSNSEGWGMAVVEAAAHGLPIIMTDVGLAGEVIKNNESGIVIPVGDQADLEKAMVRLIEDENLRNKLGAGARATVEKLPDKEGIWRLYQKSWRRALNNNFTRWSLPQGNK